MLGRIVGDISEDTFVGWNGPTAWTVRILERYHAETELDEEDVDQLIILLLKAKREMLEEKKEYERKEKEKCT